MTLVCFVYLFSYKKIKKKREREKLNPSHSQNIEIKEQQPEKQTKTEDIFRAHKSYLRVSSLNWVEKIAIQNQNTGPFQWSLAAVSGGKGGD